MGFTWGFIFGAFAGTLLGFLVACVLASGKISDIVAQRDNPKNINVRCSRK